jgi:rhodanese-related sulfurtransferase
MCWLSRNATVRTVALGYSQVYWYRGGRNAWIAAGLPLQPVRRTPF